MSIIRIEKQKKRIRFSWDRIEHWFVWAILFEFQQGKGTLIRTKTVLQVSAFNRVLPEIYTWFVAVETVSAVSGLLRSVKRAFRPF